MNHKKQLRTRFLILPQFQLKLLGANLLVLAVVASVVWIQMNRAFSDLTQAAGISGVEAHFYRRYLDFQAHSMNVALGLGFFAAVVTSTLLTLMISHRFSGPLVRLRGYFRDLAESRDGPVPKLSFRKNDVLSDLPPLVNQAIGRVQSRAPSELDREAC